MTDSPVSPSVTKNRQPFLILLAFVLFSVFVWVVLVMLGDNVNYFKTPSLITAADRQEGRPMRLGGTVAPGSISIISGKVTFSMTDGSVRETICFNGVLPDLFREGQGVVVDGSFVNGEFVALRILAKHDENYMSAPMQQLLPMDE